MDSEAVNNVVVPTILFGAGLLFIVQQIRKPRRPVTGSIALSSIPDFHPAARFDGTNAYGHSAVAICPTSNRLLVSRYPFDEYKLFDFNQIVAVAVEKNGMSVTTTNRHALLAQILRKQSAVEGSNETRDVAAEVERLWGLKQAGALTDLEFSERKRRLLDS